MKIDPSRLRELRDAKKLSQKALAERSKVSLRQIARLESNDEASLAVRERTVAQLARALGVDSDVLRGDAPMPTSKTETTRPDSDNRTQIGALLLPEIRLAYELAKRRYGVSATTLINAAPIMFTLIAESSLRWRQKNVSRSAYVEDQLDDLCEQTGNRGWAIARGRAEDVALEEEESIKSCDLFGKTVNIDLFEPAAYDFQNNPFGNYLRQLMRQIDKQGVIGDDVGESYDTGPLDNFPEFPLFSEDLDKITGGNLQAHSALYFGHVRINDIPDELWAEGATEQRAKWLESQMPASKPLSLSDLGL